MTPATHLFQKDAIFQLFYHLWKLYHQCSWANNQHLHPIYKTVKKWVYSLSFLKLDKFIAENTNISDTCDMNPLEISKKTKKGNTSLCILCFHLSNKTFTKAAKWTWAIFNNISGSFATKCYQNKIIYKERICTIH